MSLKCLPGKISLQAQQLKVYYTDRLAETKGMDMWSKHEARKHAGMATKAEFAKRIWTLPGIFMHLVAEMQAYSMYDSMHDPGAYQVILFSPSGWAELRAGQHMHVDCIFCCRWGTSQMLVMADHLQGSCPMVAGVDTDR